MGLVWVIVISCAAHVVCGLDGEWRSKSRHGDQESCIQAGKQVASIAFGLDLREVEDTLTIRCERR